MCSNWRSRLSFQALWGIPGKLREVLRERARCPRSAAGYLLSRRGGFEPALLLADAAPEPVGDAGQDDDQDHQWDRDRPQVAADVLIVLAQLEPRVSQSEVPGDGAGQGGGHEDRQRDLREARRKGDVG